MLNLLRVGADKKYGGFWSPIRSDRSYVFAPIPGETPPTYDSYRWFGQPLLSLLREQDAVALRRGRSIGTHCDPEFINCTYGSPRYINRNGRRATEKNYNALRALRAGDVLAFYAAFAPAKYVADETLAGYYLFAYITVAEIVAFADAAELSPAQKAMIFNSPHASWSNQIVVVGDKTKSMVCRLAVPFSLAYRDRRGSNYYPSEDWQHTLGGYSAALNLSSLRRFSDQNVCRAFKTKITDFGGGNLLDDN